MQFARQRPAFAGSYVDLPFLTVNGWRRRRFEKAEKPLT